MIPIINAKADSNYFKFDDKGKLIKIYEAKSIITSEDGEDNFWCSTGLHKINEEVKFNLEITENFRISALSIYWIFAPLEYKIKYTNDRINWFDLFEGFKKTINNSNNNESWRSTLASNIEDKYIFSSFQTVVDVDKPFFASQIEIIMRMPINTYFGIKKVELFTLKESLVMFKSKNFDLCLSLINGNNINLSNLVAIDCISAINYADNRELFYIHNNGYITNFNKDKCLESPDYLTVRVNQCARSNEYRDDREKFQLTFDGKIRSLKDYNTCLTINLRESLANDLFVKVTSSSTIPDQKHEAKNVLDILTDNFWASEYVKERVVFLIEFIKFPVAIKTLKIEWKFPAYKFKVFSLFPDNIWRIFFDLDNNTENQTEINLKSLDIKALKIVMIKSTVLKDSFYIYGISKLHLQTGGYFIYREQCFDNLVDERNIWELKYVNKEIIDLKVSRNLKESWAQISKLKAKMASLVEMFKMIPLKILDFKQKSIKIKLLLQTINDKFNSIEKTLIDYSQFLKPKDIKEVSLASDESLPAYSCDAVKYAFPNKRSGFYYIKNECMPKALKLYCNFQKEEQKQNFDNNNNFIFYDFDDFYIVNTREKGDKEESINSINSINKVCNDLGLETKDFKKLNEINLVKLLLSKFKVSFIDNTNNKTSIIPIAYLVSNSNYTNNNNSLSEILSFNNISLTFNNENDNKINNYNFIKNDVDTLFVNSNLLSIENDKNLLCLNSKNELIYKNFQSIISAVVCSTNNNYNSQNRILSLNCDSDLTFLNLYLNHNEQEEEKEDKTNVMFRNLKYKVMCPENCLISNKIFGYNKYSDNSVICKAAIHSGIISNVKGGIIILEIDSPLQDYLGMEKNGIISENLFNYKSVYSFTVSSFDPQCPGYNYLEDINAGNKHSSFIDLKLDESLNENTIFPDNIKSDNKFNKNDSLRNYNNTNKKNKISKELERLKSDYENINKSNNSINEDYNSKSILDLKALLFKEEESNSTIFNNNTLINDVLIDNIEINKSNLNDSKSNEVKIFNNANKDSKRRIKQTTLNYLLTLTTIYNRDIQSLNKTLNFGLSFEMLCSKLKNKFKDLKLDNNLGSSIQNFQVNEYNFNLNKIIQLIKQIEISTNFKVKKAEFDLKNLKEKEGVINYREQFLEDYTNFNKENNNIIKEKYDIFNSILLKEGKACEWHYYEYNLEGRNKIIRQINSITDDRSGSHLIIKNREFYDFELKFSVNLRSDGKFGVAFRYFDPFNYYLFEISTINKAYKRVLKYENGIKEILDIKYDGGIMKMVWNSFKIIGRNSKFEIFYMLDNQNSEINIFDTKIKYENIFNFEDNSFIKGTIAFTSNSLQSLFLDDINVIPLKCTNFDDRKINNQKIETNTCNRFTERLNNLDNWLAINNNDNINNINANYKIVLNYDQRYKVIYQSVKFTGENTNQEGSLYLLKNDNDNISKENIFCKDGIIQIKYKIIDENGIFGLIFRYNEENSNNSYYTLEVSSSEFIRLRKKIQNNFILISSYPLEYNLLNEWNWIKVELNEAKIKIFSTLKGLDYDLVKIFDIEDVSLKSGKFGISTYKIRAYFYSISSRPFKQDELDTEINNKSEEKFYDKISNLNDKIQTFTWSKCLKYKNNENRRRICVLLLEESLTKLEYCQVN